MKKQNSDYKKYIGGKIKLARNNANLTQEELAEELSLCTEHISKLERGISYGSIDTLIDICRTLNITPNYLLEDLISNDSNDFKYELDKDFIINYSKLDSHDKKTINILTKALVKQKEKEMRQ